MGKSLAVVAAVLSAATVGLGAFGAHALSDAISPRALETFRTGISYAQWHLLAMLIAGLVHARTQIPSALQAAWGFLMGVVLFSGSLVVLAITGIRILGAVAPIGGLFFILSWLFLARAIATWPEKGSTP